MCGLVGFATLNNTAFAGKTNAKFFTEALVVDTLRGKDSTGILVVGPNNMNSYKRAMPGYDFINTSVYTRMHNAITMGNATIGIGHNRSATLGAVNDMNAHPFTHDKITLVHNGTLHLYSGMEGDFETDSEDICYTISKHGAAATLPKIKGAYALVWYDEETRTVNFARNKERSFAYAIAKDNKSIYWASEGKMLSWLLVRAGIKYKGVVQSDVGLHYAFEPYGKDLSKCAQTKFVPYEEPVREYGRGGYHHGAMNQNSAMYDDTATTLMTKAKLKMGDTVGFLLTGLKTTYNTRTKQTTGSMNGDWPFTVRNILGEEIPVEVAAFNLDSELLDSVKGMINDAMLCGTITGAYVTRQDEGKHKRKASLHLSLETVYLVGKQQDLDDGSLDWCCPKVLTDEEEDENKSVTKSINVAKGKQVKKYEGAQGDLVSREELLLQLAGGCGCCGDPLDVDDAGEYEWMPIGTSYNYEPYCNSCATQAFNTYFLGT